MELTYADHRVEPELVRACGAMHEVGSNSPVTSCVELHSTLSPGRICAALQQQLLLPIIEQLLHLNFYNALRITTQNTKDHFYKLESEFCPHCLTASGVCVCDKSLQSCLTLCDPMNCSPPGSSVHEILQARILG